MIGRKSEKKGKTYEEFYGLDKAIKLKNKLSKSHKGQFTGNKHPKAKPVVQLDLNSNIVMEFGSSAAAESELNISAKSITACCRGISKTAYGFK